MTLPKEPLSRLEQYLNKIAKGAGELPSKPLSRTEQYLDYIVRNGVNGGGENGSHAHENKNILDKINPNTLIEIDKINGIEVNLKNHLENHPEGGGEFPSDLGEIVVPNLPLDLNGRPYVVIKHKYTSSSRLILIISNADADHISKKIHTSDSTKFNYRIGENETNGEIYQFINGEWSLSSDTLAYTYPNSVITTYIGGNILFKDKISNIDYTQQSIDFNYHEVQQLRLDTYLLSQYLGKKGQLVVNKETNELYIMDGITLGGHKVSISTSNQLNLKKRVEELENIVKSMRLQRNDFYR